MRKADSLPPSCAVVTKSGNLNFLEPSGPLQACNGTALPFTFIVALSGTGLRPPHPERFPVLRQPSHFLKILSLLSMPASPYAPPFLSLAFLLPAAPQSFFPILA